MELAKHCHWHEGRRAIGVCVETRRPMCAECSTQYEGVNYSRAGLEQMLDRLRAERAAAAAAGPLARLGRLAWPLLAMACPLCVLFIAWLFGGVGRGLVAVLRSAREASGLE